MGKQKSNFLNFRRSKLQEQKDDDNIIELSITKHLSVYLGTCIFNMNHFSNTLLLKLNTLTYLIADI